MNNIIPFVRFKDITDMNPRQAAEWLRRHGWTNTIFHAKGDRENFRLVAERLPARTLK